jgi:hypothetical protein
MRILRTLSIAAVVVVMFGAGAPSGAATDKLLDPLVPGWEQIFKLDWQVGERRGNPVLNGYLVNDSPYPVTAIRLLVDALDEGGNVVAQRVTWLPGGTLTPFSRTYFEVPAPGLSAKYQVRVFAFDRIEGGDGFRH